MHGLLNRLAKIDSTAERGLRIIEFFDQLVLHGADIEAVVRATAVLAEVAAGAILDEQGQICLIAPDGRVLPPSAPSPTALISEITLAGGTVGRVWLEQAGADGESHEWDELIIDRMALSMATLRAKRLETAPAPALGLTDPAVLHVLLRTVESEIETARAARLLGFQVGQQVQVIAARSLEDVGPRMADLRSAIAETTNGRVVAAAMTSNLAVIVAAANVKIAPMPLPWGISVCVGPTVTVEHSATSWAQARQGVQFAGLGGMWPHWLSVEDVGCLLALGGLDPAEVNTYPDVQAIARIAAGRSGGLDIKLLDGFGWLPSIRETATALHMHHSSVTYRIQQISESMTFDIRTADGRYRARTALILWQLHGTTQT